MAAIAVAMSSSRTTKEQHRREYNPVLPAIYQPQLENQMSSIKPTIGRVVLVRIPGVNMGTTPDQQPLPALITFVHSDSLINVGGFFPDGEPFRSCSINLIPSEEPLPQLPCDQPFAHWMEYQIQAAAPKTGLGGTLISPVPLISEGAEADPTTRVL